MKRLFGFALGALVVFMNILPLKAQSVYGVEMVKENDSVKQLFPDGTNILNTIDTSKSEFEKGKVAIEITINNSKKTEVVYVVDNGSANTIKTELIDVIKTKASNLASYNNLYQSVITNTNEGIVYKPFDTNISNSLEEVKALASGENGSFDTLLSEANSKFSTDTVNKVIVLFVSDMGSKTTDEITAIKTQVDAYKTAGVNVIVYGLGLADYTNFDNVFASTTKYQTTTTDLSTISFESNIVSLIPSNKTAVATKISFDNYILNNFEIKDIVASMGSASIDESTNEIAWGIGNIKANDIVTLTYTLNTKSVIDESLINVGRLRTNRQIVVTSSGIERGTYPSSDRIDDEECSPVIKLTEATVVNPYTGMADYIIAGACILAVSLVGILILNKKNEFNRL